MRAISAQIVRPRCPSCGTGILFKDMLTIVDACSDCGLVLKHHDAADGPTFFALVLVGFFVTGAAALVEYHFEPALWIHAALWVPITFIACIGFLRIFKALFVTLEYRLARLNDEPPHV